MFLKMTIKSADIFFEVMIGIICGYAKKSVLNSQRFFSAYTEAANTILILFTKAVIVSL